jgi:flagella basal body P-ring formation protein FlgA
MKAAALPTAVRRATLALALGLAPLLPAVAQVTPGPATALDAAWTARVEQLATQAARAAFGANPQVRVEVVAGQLDPRLKLAPCQRVDIYLPVNQRAWGRSRVGLRCLEGAVAWNVYLPLTVKVFAPALVASQALAAGTVLQAEHLRPAEVDWAAAESPVVALPASALGRTLAHGLAAGAALRDADLRKRQWFAVGDTVRVLAVGRGFTVAGEGVALTPGLEGQPARVRTEGGRLVTGVAAGERRVEVIL